VEVSLERSAALRLSVSGIDAVLLVKSIARIPSSAVLSPGSHANPAEFVLAFLACHMVASSVLLNRTLALATLLRVALDPIRSLAVVLALLKPHLCDAAHHRAVISVDVTAEAELVSIRGTTGHDRDHCCQRQLVGCSRTGDCIGARRIRTELEVAIAGDIVANNKFLVASPCSGIVGQSFAHEVIRCNNRTVLCHASDPVLGLRSYLAFDVRLPAVRTEVMLAD